MQIMVFSKSISHELNFLLYSFLLGIIITFFYDTIRIVRKIIKHNIFIVSLEDLIFWIGVTFSIFTLQYYENNGMFRWFSIIGAFLGMSIYKLTISQFYVNGISKVLLFIMKWIFKILKFLLRPIFYIENKTERGIAKILHKIGRIGKILKNRLTHKLKMIKITLCKRKRVQNK